MRITGTHRFNDAREHSGSLKALAAGLAVAILTLALVGLLSGGAFAQGGKHVRNRWQYDPGTFNKTWKSEPKLRHAFNRWHRNQLDQLEAEAAATTEDKTETLVARAERRAERRGDELTDPEVRAIEKSTDTAKIVVPPKEIKAFQAKLQKRYLAMHFHKAAGSFSGKATWFNDSHGACGKPLKGMYAAHRSLPCGTKLAVRSGGRYVHVTVLDRGPFTGAVLDLSKPAFRKLSPIGAGVISIKATRLRG